MAITLTRQGAKYLANNALGDHALRIDLYTDYDSGSTPDYESTDPSDFTNPTNAAMDGGYSYITVATSDWTVTTPASGGDNVYAYALDGGASGDPYRFTFDGSAPQDEDAIKGFYVSSNWEGSYVVLWVESDGVDFQPSSTFGDYIDITLKLEYT